MTDQSDPTSGLRQIVEITRENQFPDLNYGLVVEILDVQVRYAEDRAEAEKQTDQVVSRWVSQHPTAEREDD